MEAKELREKTMDQLNETLEALKKEGFNLRFQQATGQVENTAQMRRARRDVARVKTIINEKSAIAVEEQGKQQMPKRILQGNVTSDKKPANGNRSSRAEVQTPCIKKDYKKLKKNIEHMMKEIYLKSAIWSAFKSALLSQNQNAGK